MFINPFKDPEKPNSLLKDLLIEDFKAIIDIGDFTYGPPPTIRYWGEAGLGLKIGRYCSLADRLTFFLGGAHQTGIITTSPLRLFYGDFTHGNIQSDNPKGWTEVGNDVWIGSGATIMTGVVISDGAVIGANSVVATDVPPYAIYAGNPARLVRFRFDECIIQKLVQLQWWNWPNNKVAAHLTELTSKPSELLLNKLLAEEF